MGPAAPGGHDKHAVDKHGPDKQALDQHSWLPSSSQSQPTHLTSSSAVASFFTKLLRQSRPVAVEPGSESECNCRMSIEVDSSTQLLRTDQGVACERSACGDGDQGEW